MELQIDTKALRKALALGPRVLERHLSFAIERSVQEMARQARREAPKAFSTLTNSIRPVRQSSVESLVVAGVDYAAMVEKGTQGGSVPPEQPILDWIRVVGVTPSRPDMDEEDLAYVIARSIAARGTPAQPFMAPAFEGNKRRAERRINKAIDDALKEMMR